MNRIKILLLLAVMPEEAFGWVIASLAQGIFPDGLGGFQNDSRESITEVRKAAEEYMS